MGNTTHASQITPSHIDFTAAHTHHTRFHISWTERKCLEAHHGSTPTRISSKPGSTHRHHIPGTLCWFLLVWMPSPGHHARASPTLAGSGITLTIVTRFESYSIAYQWTSATGNPRFGLHFNCAFVFTHSTGVEPYGSPRTHVLVKILSATSLWFNAARCKRRCHCTNPVFPHAFAS